jgi:hypothetical protein
MRVFSFYTNELYKEQAEKMAATAEFFGLETELVSKPDLGTWWQNVNQKCRVILEMIEKYPDEPTVWTDADCRYMSNPHLFREIGEYDIALFNATTDYPFSGVLWLNGKKALPYIQRWVTNVERNPRMEDDSTNLKAALRETWSSGIFHLPPAYCWHPRDMRARYPGAKPVIVHTTVGDHNYPGVR